jgi:hypothetical protein
MKPSASIGSHTTIERTNNRQEQDIRMVLKMGSFAGLGKGRGKVEGCCGQRTDE